MGWRGRELRLPRSAGVSPGAPRPRGEREGWREEAVGAWETAFRKKNLCASSSCHRFPAGRAAGDMPGAGLSAGAGSSSGTRSVASERWGCCPGLDEHLDAGGGGARCLAFHLTSSAGLWPGNRPTEKSRVWKCLFRFSICVILIPSCPLPTVFWMPLSYLPTLLKGTALFKGLGSSKYSFTCKTGFINSKCILTFFFFFPCYSMLLSFFLNEIACKK